MKTIIAASVLALGLSQAAFATNYSSPGYCNGNESLTSNCQPAPSGPYYDHNHQPYYPINEGADYGQSGPQYKICSAVDSTGRSFHFYQSKEFSTAWMQRQAVGVCHSQSRHPNSCAPAGCRWYR